MKILLTGANGYIGRRLLPVLVEEGHQVVCSVRDKNRLELPDPIKQRVEIIEVDFLADQHNASLPKDIDVAYYLIHSMSSKGNFEAREQQLATRFVNALNQTSCKQLIYLSGIANKDQELSKHLRSRLKTENILKSAKAKHTVLRAGIIVGSGSASFEIIRDLVEKLPVMVAPKWLKTKCQPIAIRNVIFYLSEVIKHKACLNQVFDIGGNQILAYKQMLLQFAQVRGIKRSILTVPVMTPRLSSYWLYFVTSTSYSLAVNLVDSMKVDVLVEEGNIKDIIPQKLFTYKESVQLAFDKIEQHMVVSSWKDALVNSRSKLQKLSQYIEVPKDAVFTDVKKRKITNTEEQVLENIFSIGGERGWYYGSFLWSLRGFIDRLAGGVGLRRGRTSATTIEPGDALDFWRVLVADKEKKRLLLYAEMKLPGDAWLEFCIQHTEKGSYLHQTATFRPKGIFGRLYWYSVLPFHYFVFNGMITNLERFTPVKA